ncbi:MAG: hypothetical protein ACFCVE_02410, partial [Phycisphaerae bacterium]
LDHSLEAGAEPAVSLKLMTSLQRALLAARQYDRVSAFTGEMIRRNPQVAQDLGGLIKIEAERLKEAGEQEQVGRLVASAAGIDPPLPERYLRQLRALEGEPPTTLPGTGTSGPQSGDAAGG